MIEHNDMQRAVREASSTMREHLLTQMQAPGRTPGKEYRKGIESLAETVREQVTRFVDDLSTTVREEVDEFTRAAWEVKQSK